ncbi:hypothetical protein D3C75_1140690 [compost metagenome]
MSHGKFFFSLGQFVLAVKFILFFMLMNGMYVHCRRFFFGGKFLQLASAVRAEISIEGDHMPAGAEPFILKFGNPCAQLVDLLLELEAAPRELHHFGFRDRHIP